MRVCSIVLFALATTCAAAQEQARVAENSLGTVLEETLTAETLKLLTQVRTAAAEAGVTVDQARDDLELIALYRKLRTRGILIDYSTVKIPRPDRAALASEGVTSYAPEPLWTLEQIDAAIKQDEEYLDRPGNNASNEEYVKSRRPALVEIREQVIQGLRQHLVQEVDAGNELAEVFLRRRKVEAVTGEFLAAEQRLGKSATPNSTTMRDATSAIEQIQDLQKRRQRERDAEELHRSLAEAVPTDKTGSPAPDDWTVLVIRIHSREYGGYDKLKPGAKTTMLHRDSYHVLLDQSDKMSARMETLKRNYEFAWKKVSQPEPMVKDSTLEIVAYGAGLSHKEGSAAESKARTLLKAAGYGYSNEGYMGPLHRVRQPWTVPANVGSIE